MSINARTDLWPVVDAELPAVLRKHADHADAITAAVDDLKQQYAERIFAHGGEVLALCRSIDEHPLVAELPPAVKETLKGLRRKIGLVSWQKSPGFAAMTVPVMDPDGTLRAGNDDFDVIHPDTGEKMKPRDVLKTIMIDYLALAGQLGETQLMQLLLRMGILTKSDVPTASRILKAYLGTSARPTGIEQVDWIFRQSPDFLRDPAIHELVHRLLRQGVYEELRARSCDSRLMHTRTLNDLGRTARLVVERLCKKAKIDPSAHEALIARIEQEWWDIAALTPGDGMVDELEAEGEMHPFPSLRQRIALYEIRRQQHLYIGFEPGLGKTATALWAWHDLNQKRAAEKRTKTQLCYVVSPEALRELAKSVPDYFTDGHKPEVGVIDGEVSDNALEEALQKDVVFVSSKMLHVKRHGVALYERLKGHRHADTDEAFGMLVVDEAHQFKGDKTMTDVLDSLIRETPGLYDDGRVLFMSGTPATNDLSDIVVQLGMLENRRGGVKTNLRDTASLDPIALRNRLNRMLILDPPIPWQKKEHPWGYDLSPREHSLIRMIVQNDTLNAAEKRTLILRAIRTPDLTSGDGDMPCSLFDNQSTCLKEDLDTKPTVLIAEFMHVQGIFRGFDNKILEDEEVERIFFQKVSVTCQEWEREKGIPVRFHVIFGDTSKADRERAFADARESAANPTKSRTVILAFGSCVNLGKDLRCIKAMHTLQYPFNLPDLQQLLMRSFRAGHEDIILRAFFANGTLEEGIYDYARDKYHRVMSCLYGHGMSDEELKQLTENDADGMKNRRIQRMLQSPERHREKLEQYKHGRGSKYALNFARKHEHEFRDELKNADGMGHMDHQRCIAGLVQALEEKGVIAPGAYLHTQGQGAFLQRMLSRQSPNDARSIVSIETMQSHADEGKALLQNGERAKARTIVGTPADIGRNLRNGTLQKDSMDAVILEGVQTLKGSNKEGVFSQRAKAIIQAARTLKEGGTLVLPLSRNSCTKQEFENLQRFVSACGIDILRGWTGEATSTDNHGDAPSRMFVLTGTKTSDPSLKAAKNALNAEPLTLTHKHNWGEGSRERGLLEGERRRRKAPFPIVHRAFKVGTHAFEVNANGGNYLAQRQHLDALEIATAAVRDIVEKPAALWTAEGKIDPAIRTQLKAAGIEFLPNMTSRKDRPAFVLRKYPDHLVYPFDQQWKAAE